MCLQIMLYQTNMKNYHLTLIKMCSDYENYFKNAKTKMKFSKEYLKEGNLLKNVI